MALDRTRYMQAGKTFVMVDRPFWKDIDPATGRPLMSMTLTDRLTRGTYFFDNGPDRPGVICLSYVWMTDALKVLPLPTEKRVELALSALANIYPGVDISSHIRGNPICVSWEADENFLGAFKGALPGHYRYNRRLCSRVHPKSDQSHDHRDQAGSEGEAARARHHRHRRILGVFMNIAAPGQGMSRRGVAYKNYTV